ncbi:MAG: lysylphosphatidylglycerol synthase transmembrane domain-containing protein [Lysobacterales bacterium]|jgi:uncharacterized protein (TIRG00374 family)
MKSKSSHALGFGIMVSALALYFALRNVEMAALHDAMSSAKPSWMVLVLVTYITHFWLKAMRWCDLLEPVYKARAGEAYPVMMTGFFANNFLPAHLGEFVRMWVGGRVFGVSKTEVLATIVLERILDFSVIALMFGSALVAGEVVSGQLVYAGYVLLALTVLAWIGIFVALRFEKGAQRIVGWLLRPFPGGFSARIEEMFSLALSAMHSLKSMRLVVRIVLLSLLQWALIGLAVYAALAAIGIQIGMAAAFVTLAATVLAVSLPAAPGFFGTVQLAFVLALAPYGIAESDALAGSIIFHLVSYLFVMVSGLIALHQLNLKFSDLKR